MLCAVTQEELVASLRSGAAETAGWAPMTSAVLQRLGERLSMAKPPLWSAVEGAWAGRWFLDPRGAWRLWLAGLHYQALRHPGHPLSLLFQTTHGRPGDPSRAVDELLDAPPDALVRHLQAGLRPSYRDYWSMAWMDFAASLFQRRGLPYVLAEVGTIGGLGASADLHLPREGFDSSLIVARVGFEAEPLDLHAPEGKTWLQASAYPDDVEHFAMLQRAVERYRALETPVQLVACDPVLSAAAIARNVRPDKKTGLVVLTTWATDRMMPPEFARFRHDLIESFKAWEDRALWLQLSEVPGSASHTEFQLAAHRLRDGALKGHVLGRVALGAEAAQVVSDADANAAFLA